MNENITMSELESFLNVTDNLINDLVRKGNINNNTYNDKYGINEKLNKLHNYRKQIIKEIENKLDETFSAKTNR